MQGTEINEVTSGIQSGSNHSCSLTPRPLIAMQLRVQLGRDDGPWHKINRNQLNKDIWFWMDARRAVNSIEIIFGKSTKQVVGRDVGQMWRGTKLHSVIQFVSILPASVVQDRAGKINKSIK